MSKSQTLAEQIRALPADQHVSMMAYYRGFEQAREAAAKLAAVREQAFQDAIAAELDENLQLFAALGIDAEALEKMPSHSTALVVERIKELRQTTLDCSMLVRRLCYRLRNADYSNNRNASLDLIGKALDYLRRKGLQGSPLRDNGGDPTAPETQQTESAAKK